MVQEVQGFRRFRVHGSGFKVQGSRFRVQEVHVSRVPSFQTVLRTLNAGI
jgi:hypothetical protein